MEGFITELESWSLDEVAECLDVGQDIAGKCYHILRVKCAGPAPVLETPDQLFTRFTNIVKWREEFTDDEVRKINAAWRAEY